VIRVQHLDTLLGDPQTPVRAHDDDAGWDLHVSETTIIDPHSFTDIPTGIAMELPSWSWGMLTGRSSTLRKRGLLVHTGIIDAGYRGELFIGVWNLTNEEVRVDAGDRIGQLIILDNATARTVMRKINDDEALGAHARGTKGFGSSGK